MPSGTKRDHLAVEDQPLRRQRAHGLDDLRHGGGHVVQRAREDAHLVAGLVHLDARAVELVLERGVAEIGQRLVDVGAPSRRASAAPAAAAGGETRRARPRRSASAARATGARSPASIAARRTRAAGRPAARATASTHHALERALAQLAEEQPHQERLLVGRPRGAKSCRSSSTRRRAAPAPETPATAPNVASTSAKRQRRVSAGGTSRASRIAAPPTPSRPWGVLPDKNAIADGSSSAGTCERNSAMWRILPSRLEVSVTRREVATRAQAGQACTLLRTV